MMNLATNTVVSIGIQAEWERVAVLAQCLLRSRAGQAPESEQITRLQYLQQQIERLRQGANSPWRKLPTQVLSPLAFDVLACVLASEAQPRVGWLYQELQSGNPQPFLTPALLHLLLALKEDEMGEVQRVIGADGALQRSHLIEWDGHSAFSPLRPVKGVVATLMDWPQAEHSPPGAILVTQQADWSELILPSECILMLREFLLWLRHRDTVVGAWGGKAVGGPVVLFSGPSGTGKTFAAVVLATELGWPLYRVDLARLVSKYIGETEKNIGRLFDAAHDRQMILQFDEADALMGKRGEIKEARDRYANLEVSYLLSRIEEHQGPCILTTNWRSQIDKAFSRRFQMVVEFPRPDEAARVQLWNTMLPPRAPRSEDLDVECIARAVNLTGGNIRNAALHAAYLAAEDSAPINMGHVATAIWREFPKDRLQTNTSDLGILEKYLPKNVYSGNECHES